MKTINLRYCYPYYTGDVFVEVSDEVADEGYKNARSSEKRGEIKIRNHAAVMAGKLYPDKKPPAQER